MTRTTPMPYSLRDLPADAEFDVIVVGAGAAGLSAALFAHLRGAKVTIVEKTSLVGGTTAYTAGTFWIPGTRLALDSGAPADDREVAARYLDEAVGDRSDRELRTVFLETGPEAIDVLSSAPGMQLRARPEHPDYMAELPDAALGYRPLEAVTVDGSKVPNLGLVRQQTPEFTVFGGLMLEHPEIASFSEVARAPFKPRNWKHVVHAGLVFARHLLTRPFNPRAARMTMGNAFVGRLMIGLRDVPIYVNTSVEEIREEGGRVVGSTLVQEGERRSVRITRGLIAATGGFNRHPERRRRLMPQVPEEWSPMGPGNTGELHDQIEALGGHYREMPDTQGFWAPVSLVPRRDGEHGVYPHFAIDRGKPGFIVVDQDGERYLNESMSYHRVGLAMQERTDGKGMPSYLIADARAVKRFGLGAVKPGGWGISALLRNGYLVSAGTLSQLAVRLGIAPDRLVSTVERFNRFAETGVDEDFGRGTNAYERKLGDPTHGPNPSLGALKRGPFFAIRLYPGDIGAATGFRTDPAARVVREDGTAIDGLYAIGNDMASVMGDRYPGPGITLGPAIVFAYIAVRDALGRDA